MNRQYLIIRKQTVISGHATLGEARRVMEAYKAASTRPNSFRLYVRTAFE